MNSLRVTMRIFLVILALATAVLAAPRDFIAPIEDYHTEYGIPQAARIKAAEEALDFDGRITGGNFAQLGWFPYMGGLFITMTSGSVSVCGSSLLSHTRLVSTAHCWRSRINHGRHITVVLGSVRLFFGGLRIHTNQVVVHPHYNMNNLNNNIVIININHVGFNAHINRVLLPAGNDQYVGHRAIAVGFGRLRSNLPVNQNQALSYVYLNVISNAECRRYYPYDNIIHSNMCTSGVGPRGPCPGDGGGPLVVGGPVLIGVISFNTYHGCPDGRPSVYTRVTSFVPWIRSHL